MSAKLTRLRSVKAAAAAGALVAGFLVAGPAWAATTVGNAGPTYGGVTNPPTSDKPQSKLWWNDGSWWAYMWVTGTGWQIERLNRSTHQWVDTGVLVDTRASTLGDTLWDGAHLYISSQVATISSDTSTKVSQSGQPARLYRYSYSGGKYTLDSGFPVQINNNSSESLTIDEDTQGRIWATWTQVAGNSTSGYKSTVYVNVSSVGGGTWQTPFVVPSASDPNPTPDDISSVVAFKGRIGVMWTDQGTGDVWWAWRNDSQPLASWHVSSATQGTKLADDHLNLKSLQADSSGRVFAAVKTSLDSTYALTSTQPQLILLVFKPGTGAFSSSTISRISDCQTRPQVVLDQTNNLVRVYSAGPSTSVTGCPYAGAQGAIYMKTASLDNPVFATGRGTAVIEDGSSANVNNVTTSKQAVTGDSGAVVLASNNTTKQYWFADSAPTSSPTVPAASFSASPTTGTAPLEVQFTDLSTSTPTSWAWDFGDGSTSTLQGPSHTFTSAGTYTVKLTATNSAGSNIATKTGLITVSTSTSSGSISVGASTSKASAATATVSLYAPSGMAAGDSLVATFNADLAPTVTSAPQGGLSW